MAQKPTPILFRAIPNKYHFKLEVVDPSDEEKTIIEEYYIYVKGSGCPVPVVIETDRISAEYEANYPSPEDRETLPIDEYLAKARRANFLLYRDTLVEATVPQMSFDTANILANDQEEQTGLKILTLSGWKDEPVAMPANEETEEETASEEEKTPKGEDVTGE